MSDHMSYNNLSDHELKIEVIEYWVSFLRWNKVYLEYCGAVQDGNDEIRLELEDKFPIISALYSDFGDIFEYSNSICSPEVMLSRLNRFSVIKLGLDFKFSFPAGLSKSQIIDKLEDFFNENPDSYKNINSYEILIHSGETLKSTCQRLYAINFVAHYFHYGEEGDESWSYAGIADEIYNDEEFKIKAGLKISSKASAAKTAKRYHDYFARCVDAALGPTFPPKLVKMAVASK